MSGACSEIIDDIEDLISSQELAPKIRYSYRKDVTMRVVKKKLSDAEPEPKYICDSVIPGTQTIYIKTWGCTHNTSDSEYMAGQLQSFGYKITGMIFIVRYQLLMDQIMFCFFSSADNKMEADLWLLNSCTVKTPAEDHFR